MAKALDRNGDENGQRKRLGLTSWVEDARGRLFKRMQNAGWSSLLAIFPQHIVRSGTASRSHLLPFDTLLSSLLYLPINPAYSYSSLQCYKHGH